jgi:hypothetical protein
MYDATPDFPDLPDADSAANANVDPEQPQAPVTPRKRRHLLPFEIYWPAMLLIVFLIAATAFLLLLNQGTLSDDVLMWWPIAIAAPAVLWFLTAILRRDAKGMLASSVVFGIGFSLLLAVQKVAPLGSSVVGITLIAVGTGVMLRGLLLRNQPIASMF